LNKPQSILILFFVGTILSLNNTGNAKQKYRAASSSGKAVKRARVSKDFGVIDLTHDTGIDLGIIELTDEE